MVTRKRKVQPNEQASKQERNETVADNSHPAGMPEAARKNNHDPSLSRQERLTAG